MTVSKLIELLNRANSPDALVSIEYTTDIGNGDEQYRDDATAVTVELETDGDPDRVIIR